MATSRWLLRRFKPVPGIGVSLVVSAGVKASKLNDCFGAQLMSGCRAHQKQIRGGDAGFTGTDHQLHFTFVGEFDGIADGDLAEFAVGEVGPDSRLSTSSATSRINSICFSAASNG